MSNTIPNSAVPNPLAPHIPHLPLVGEGGRPTAWATQQQQGVINHVNGTGRNIPAINTGGTGNAIALTLAGSGGAGGGPLLEKYAFGDVFSFVAAANSTGPVTATVNPQTGSLATLKVYKSNGAARADNGDIVSGQHYVLHYVPTIDQASGGAFVLR